MNYTEIQLPLPHLHFRELGKPEFRIYRDWFLKVIPERMQELRRAVRSDLQFYDWEPDETLDSLVPLGHWLMKNVATQPRSEEDQQKMREGLGRMAEGLEQFYPHVLRNELTPRTLSIAFDVGIYMGLVALRLFPALRWEQVVRAKNDIDYGQVVVKGIGKVPFGVIRVARVIVGCMVRGTDGPDQLREVLDRRVKQWLEAGGVIGQQTSGEA